MVVEFCCQQFVFNAKVTFLSLQLLFDKKKNTCGLFLIILGVSNLHYSLQRYGRMPIELTATGKYLLSFKFVFGWQNNVFKVLISKVFDGLRIPLYPFGLCSMGYTFLHEILMYFLFGRKNYRDFHLYDQYVCLAFFDIFVFLIAYFVFIELHYCLLNQSILLSLKFLLSKCQINLIVSQWLETPLGLG